jgi:YfiH family protein
MVASPLALFATNLRVAGFPHGFSTRAGGVSAGALATLNFGAGDEPANLAENLRRFAEEAGFLAYTLRQVNQVHGSRVVDAAALPSDSSPREEADALVLAPGGSGSAKAVGVRVADCVPILVATRDRGEVAAIHAGWRGVAANVVAEAIARLEGKDVVAAIGPCIGSCCFEVGSEVVEQLLAATGGEKTIVARRDGEKAYVDLRLAARIQLRNAGASDVEDVPGCTRCDAERFFSYRRDGASSGRHLAAIALRHMDAT